jgi:hypothetical protein
MLGWFSALRLLLQINAITTAGVFYRCFTYSKPSVNAVVAQEGSLKREVMLVVCIEIRDSCNLLNKVHNV